MRGISAKASFTSLLVSSLSSTCLSLPFLRSVFMKLRESNHLAPRINVATILELSLSP